MLKLKLLLILFLFVGLILPSLSNSRVSDLQVVESMKAVRVLKLWMKYAAEKDWKNALVKYSCCQLHKWFGQAMMMGRKHVERLWHLFYVYGKSFKSISLTRGVDGRPEYLVIEFFLDGKRMMKYYPPYKKMFKTYIKFYEDQLKKDNPIVSREFCEQKLRELKRNDIRMDAVMRRYDDHWRVHSITGH